MLNEQQIYWFGQIQISQTEGQLYIVISPNGECSLQWPYFPPEKAQKTVRSIFN